jgi:hypothetical protein
MSSKVITPQRIARQAGGGPGIPSQPAQARVIQPVSLPIHLWPPERWENLDQSNYVALPAVAAQANIVQFQVPLGRHGIIKKIANNFVGGGWVEGSGAVVWQILVDGAPPPGATSYDNILTSLGNPSNPVEIAGFRIFENQVVTIVVKNVAVALAGQLAGGRLVGFLYPRDMETDNLWV